MKLIKNILKAFCVGAVLLGSSAQAENLNDALRWAYAENPELVAARANLRAVKENVNLANAAALPQINFRGQFNRSGADDLIGEFRTNDTASMTLSASLLLWDGGQTGLAVDSAQANLRAAAKRLEFNEQQVLLQTVSAYLDVLRDRQLVAMASGNVKLLNTRLRSARVEYDAGSMTRTELSQTEAQAAQSNAQLALAQANLSQSEAQYRKMTLRKPGKLASVGGIPKLPNSLDQATEQANVASPLIAAATETERAAQYDLRRAENGRMPSVNLSGSATRSQNYTSSNTSDNAQIGITVDVPIYQGGRISSLERQAESLLMARSAETNNTRFLVRQNVANAWAILQNAVVNSRAQQQVVEAQQLADEGSTVQYELGAITVVERLETEQALLNARSDALSASYRRQFAAYNLLAQIGKLDVNTLGLGGEIDALVVPVTPKTEAPSANQIIIEKLTDRWGSE